MASKETNRKAWIGAFATLGAAILLSSLFLIGKKQNMFGSTIHVNAVFSNVSGLKAGNYVRFSGVRSGIVDNITFLNDSMIVVRMKIDSKLQHLIKKDDVVFISTEGLVGDKIVEIKPEWKSIIAVQDNDTLAAINPFDTHEIIDKLLATNDNAKVITANLAKLSEDVSKRKSIFKTVVSDSNAANDLKDIISNLKSTSASFAQMTMHLQKVSDNINMNKGVAGELFNDTTLSKELQNTIGNLQQASINAVSIINQLNGSINSKNNTVGMLIQDTAVASNLRQSIESLKTSAHKLDESMDALQHNFLLRGYFKKKNK